MTDTELILLGLVAEGDCYGYQIEAKIKARNIRNWADIGFSSIYYVLAKLEKQGLVTSKQEKSPQGPSRRVFAITTTGRKLLTGQTLYRLAQRIPLPSSFYAGLALLKHVDLKAASKALAEHARGVRARLDQLNRDRQSEHTSLAEAMFDLGYRLAEAEESWLEEFHHRLEESQVKPDSTTGASINLRDNHEKVKGGKMSSERTKAESIKSLRVLRNIGPATARRLCSIGIESPEQLKQSDPEELYEKLKKEEGGKLDRCVLYQLRGAVLHLPWPKCKNLTTVENKTQKR